MKRWINTVPGRSVFKMGALAVRYGYVYPSQLMVIWRNSCIVCTAHPVGIAIGQRWIFGLLPYHGWHVVIQVPGYQWAFPKIELNIAEVVQ
jgi:hypothetical protein